MTKLEQIERSIAALSPKELKAFAKWFEAFQADVWDKQIQADAKAGRLDGFAKRRWPKFEPSWAVAGASIMRPQTPARRHLTKRL
ncbi:MULTISPECIES: hypothetical protein [Mesorhizobium]|uniref:hypothetical protein n=1 Tax=Mesorhizobium TaxID=68287 RepID=UPI0013E9111C|nr:MULTISPECIES: hypothetical protein [Mesorhizobium]